MVGDLHSLVGRSGPSSAFYRVFIAALVLVPWRILSALVSPRERGRVAGVSRRAFLLALGGGVFFGFDLALYNTSVMRTTATTATLFGNNAPIFVGIGTWIFFRRRPKRNFWIGLALAMSGAAVLMIANATRPDGSTGDFTGALMSLGAAAFFAAYLLATEHVREEMDTLTFSTIAVAGSVLTLLAVCLVVGAPLSGFTARTLGGAPRPRPHLAARGVPGLAYALGHLPATVTSVGLLAQVPLTAILAVPLLGEPLTPPYLAGGALVLAGIWVVNRDSRSRQSSVVSRSRQSQSAVAVVSRRSLRDCRLGPTTETVDCVLKIPDCRLPTVRLRDHLIRLQPRPMLEDLRGDDELVGAGALEEVREAAFDGRGRTDDSRRQRLLQLDALERRERGLETIGIDWRWHAAERGRGAARERSAGAT